MRRRLAAGAAAGAAAPRLPTPGRVVPPTLRLRIEEQRPTTPTPPLPTQRRRRAPCQRADRAADRPAAPVSRAARRRGRQRRRAAGTRRPRRGRGASRRSAAAAVSRAVGPRRRRRAVRVRCRRSRFARSSPACRRGPGQYPQRPGMPQRPPMRPSFRQRPGRPAPRRDATARPSAPPMPAAPPPVTRTITLAEGMTVKDLADKLDLRVKDVLAKLLMKRLMMTINSTLDTDTATMLAREFGADVADAQLRRGADRDRTPTNRSAGGHRDRARRSSPSWATSTTARRACSTPSAKRASPSARPAASRSTSARITSRSTAGTSCSSTRRATRRSR